MLSLYSSAQAMSVDTRLAHSLAAWVEETCRAESVDVEWMGFEDRYSEDPELSFEWQGQPCRRRPELRLHVYRGGEQLARRMISVRLKIYVRTLVAAEDAARGELVVTRPGLAALDSLRGDPVPEGRWRARTNIRAGDSLTTAFAEPMPDRLSGEAVEIVTRRGSLEVTAPGRLLGDARVGERVRVVNEATRVTLEGVLLESGQVEIR